ncbi:DUF6242 domain-containing protein [Bacteroides pyogenes]|uniref:DUF6242 domain-containing protein n=1 Tax=Bacteroides pyogenes TaxID=310300 RepID=UPI001BAD041E|nr:DUF6242 domain-containing protein [Bacteroides pyogenes]MBR8726447.1 hypothetical protein [Bacteroides pyogenes]MBR8739781.1 hypothetical protein [Bacteroides pyogenes]MBR8755596.1 hypothetical protein [Bacteroides pyogenes]MBR8796895.1 hypothetical protein [Bacteroides pyogenes]MBR8810483.1 hypothetical protein [Bacteroides pyogenes]
MKIKFLSIIASFFLASFVITSCLDNDKNNIEYSSDATIHAFELDTIGRGITYKFTIDQMKGEIYNEDSIPVHADTIVDRILIKKMATASGIITMKDKSGQDSIINLSDSFDLRKPVVFTVYAPDMQNKKTYKVDVRRHKHDPDSLLWTYIGKIQDEITGAQKTVRFKNGYYLYSVVNNTLKVYQSNDLKQWDGGKATTGITDGLPTSIIAFDEEKLLLASFANKVYESADGISWKESDKIKGNISTLVSLWEGPEGDRKLTYIKEENEEKYICEVAESFSEESEKKIKLPANFPTEDFSYTTIKKESNTYNIIVGKHFPSVAIDPETTTTIVWGYDGNIWTDLSPATNPVSYCPEFEHPVILHYNNQLYIWGDEFKSIYTSRNEGVSWSPANPKFAFPHQNKGEINTGKSLFEGRTNFSVIHDTEKDYIYVLFSTPNVAAAENNIDHRSQVWRGRLNSLWFLHSRR